jgi:hypothetical protein
MGNLLLNPYIGLSFDGDVAKTQNDVAAGRKPPEAHLLAENRDGNGSLPRFRILISEKVLKRLSSL